MYETLEVDIINPPNHSCTDFQPTDSPNMTAFYILLVINLACAVFLYKNTKKHRYEWALSGFLGGIVALIFFWLASGVKKL